jgi:hypothetical protein
MHRPEREFSEQLAQAAFSFVQIPIVTQLSKLRVMQPRLVRIDFPRMEIKNGRPSLVAVQPLDAGAVQPYGSSRK